MIPVGICAFADLVLCILAFGPGLIPSPWFGIVHTGLTLSALATLRAQPIGQIGWNWPAMLLGSALGPCGIIALANLGPFTKLQPKHANTARNTAVHRKGRSQAPAASFVSRFLDGRIAFPEEDQVESLATILRHGDLQSRCKALEVAVRSFEPSLSPLIAIALSDPDQTIRALAASASSQVSKNLTMQVARKDLDAEKEPEKLLEFALQLFDHGTNNVLLSEAQRVDLRVKSRGFLVELLGGSGLDGPQRKTAEDTLVQMGTKHSEDGLVQPHLEYFEAEDTEKA